MENRQWAAEYQQQSVVMSVERTDESSDNGICDNLLEDAGKGSDVSSTNAICDNNSRIQVVEAAIRLIFLFYLMLKYLKQLLMVTNYIYVFVFCIGYLYLYKFI